jgi:hypothetical protein
MDSGDILGDRLLKNALRKTADEAREQYSHIIIRIIRVNELYKYYPLYDDRTTARHELRDALGDSEIVELVLSHFMSEEQKRYIRDGANTDRILAQLLTPIRKFPRAMLMAELPEKAAGEIWRRAGSWHGAMELAGHNPLRPKEKLAVQKFYAATNASVYNLPAKMLNKLSPLSLDELTRLCELSRKLRRPPQPHELPDKFLRTLKARMHSEGVSPNTVLLRAGIDYSR